jgi:LysM repeat protein
MHSAWATRRPGRLPHYLVPAVFALLLAALVVVVVATMGARTQSSAGTHAAAKHRLPPYYRVHSGDTLGAIAAKTGLPVTQLEAFNPRIDPLNLTPGQRLNLWANPPVPAARVKHLGPRFWTLRRGESFGSIAAKTGISITTIEQLNPRLNAKTLQPGDRVQLRP